jgi:ketosteroid isomerase-like protein
MRYTSALQEEVAIMVRLRRCAINVLVFAILGSATGLIAQEAEKAKAEAVVRNYEHACETFDFATANSLLSKDARWIENSYPEPAEFNGKGWSKRWEEYKAARLRIQYELRDLDTHISGDVAWITLALDSRFTADNAAALALNENLAEWRGTFVETYVLVKIGNVWKIALGHTSLLPKEAE